MKTLRETHEEKEALRKQGRDEDTALLASVRSAGIPLAEGATESKRETLREGLQNHRMPRIGVACDQCKTELLNTMPGVVLTSNPPKISIGCPGCGWTGYKTVR